MRWPARSKAASGTSMTLGISSAAAGDGSGMPSEPSTRRSFGDQARKVSDLPRALPPAAPAARQGRELASAAPDRSRCGSANSRRPRCLRRSRSASRAWQSWRRRLRASCPPKHRGPPARRHAGQPLKFSLGGCCVHGRKRRDSKRPKIKCEAADAVEALDPGVPYESRWAPYVRAHGPGQGQFPKGSIRPRGYMAPDAQRSFAGVM